jgi:hypothetical protein
MSHFDDNLRRYWASKFNVFDGIIVICSVIELILNAFDIFGASGISALRSLRLMRIFKLARSFRKLQVCLLASAPLCACWRPRPVAGTSEAFSRAFR